MAEQMPQSDRAKGGAPAIARLNDGLRDNIHAPGRNRVVMTRGVAELIGDVSLFRNFHKRAELLRAIRGYDGFDQSNDPHGERDMGRFAFEGTDCYWKIDYHNADLTAGSEDPADPSLTTRVLTIMRVDEW